MDITLEQASAIAEIVGGIAVIASLLYLATQVRQGTRTPRAWRPFRRLPASGAVVCHADA